MKPILIVLPVAGFDPSEAAIPWQQLTRAGEHVRFATPDGRPAAADPLMVTGEGLDPWGWAPGLKKLVVTGCFLRANADARRAYQAMIQAPEYDSPLTYDAIDPADYDGILFPGGHAKPIRPYLESEALQALARRVLAGCARDEHLPLAAICHGVLVLARATMDDGRSVIADREVTALTWALERKAWQTARLTRFWEPDYYRTYADGADRPAGYMSVEAEISRCQTTGRFLDVAAGAPDYRRKTGGLHRDSATDSRPAWVVRDGNLVTGRWPGDAHAFVAAFLEVIHGFRQREQAHD